LFGEDSWLDIVSKLITIATLLFGVVAFFYNVEPLLGKLRAERQRVAKQEELLRAQQQLMRRLMMETTALTRERGTLQQKLEKSQKTLATYHFGIVLSNLIDIKRYVQKDALAYQQNPEPFDLRDYALGYAKTELKRLGPVTTGSPESYRKEALEFFRSFTEKNIQPKATDVGLFDRLLEAYEQQGQGAAGVSP
jgi:hypothetical protein